MAPPRRTSVCRSKSRAWHVLLVAAGSIWSCHCFASLWEDLFSSPDQWADFRADKVCGKKKQQFPDFKREKDGKALWIDNPKTPAWVEKKLKEEGNLWKPRSSRDDLWQDLIDSPHAWEDFRTKKRSPRFPDFKRKEDGTSLWLDSNETPDWVATKLMEIEDKLATSSSTPASSAKEHLWQDLIDSPHAWEDFRTKKRSPRFPDFKRKEDGMSLWFDGYETPDWVATKLMEIEDKLAAPEWARGKLEVGDSTEPPQSDFFPRVTDPTEIERLWRELLGPDEKGWLDCRESKKLGGFHPGHPDFIKNHTREGLWCDDTAPEWAIEKLKELDAETVTEAQNAWT